MPRKMFQMPIQIVRFPRYGDMLVWIRPISVGRVDLYLFQGYFRGS